MKKENNRVYKIKNKGSDVSVSKDYHFKFNSIQFSVKSMIIIFIKQIIKNSYKIPNFYLFLCMSVRLGLSVLNGNGVRYSSSDPGMTFGAPAARRLSIVSD